MAQISRHCIVTKYVKYSVLIVTLTLIFNLTVYASSKLPSGISWFEGSVESAFEEGIKQNKPLFLYWGAVWCPPCNHIKNNIFSKNLFKKAIANYIPVYLDGDEPRAQIWSDRLGAKGYPTMLIYTPAGEEAMRIPWDGITLNKYVSLMESALKEMKPIGELYKNALAGKLSDDEWHLIACYSWDQDYTLKLDDQEKIKALKTFYEKIPLRLDLDKSRIFFHYLATLSSMNSKISVEEKNNLKSTLKKVLKSPQLVHANIESLAYLVEDIFPLLFEENDPKLSMYSDMWGKAMLGVENDKSLTVYERMSGAATPLYLHKINYKEQDYPEEMKEHILKRAYWASLEADNSYARQAVMSTAIYLLRETSQYEIAKKMATDELSISNSPYYYMSSLSKIALAMDNEKEALGWLKKGWESAEGHSTKFQWATSYLTGIMEYDSENKELLKTTFLNIFEDLLADEDAFSGRKMARLDRIEKKIKSWNKDDIHREFLISLKQDLGMLCVSSNHGSTCTEWISDL